MDGSASVSPEKVLSLEQQVARLQALLEASRQVHSAMLVNEVLTQTARILVRELEMEGALFLEPSSDAPVASYGDLPAAPYENCCRYTLVSKENQPLLELVVAPPAGGELSFYDQDFVEGLVLQTTVALENATLHERDLKWARVQQDLDAARSVQSSLLPREMPEIPAFSIAGRSTACYEVGGDYMDTMRLADGSHLMVVADVAGKGLASAIVACSFRSAMRSLAGQLLPLDGLATRLNQQHYEDGTQAQLRYVTAAFVRLHAERAEIEIVNAGHNPAALVRPDGSVVMVNASGTPLGMLPGMSYEVERFDFPAGSRILLYTDGLTEVFHGASEFEEEFGTERLVAAFRGHPSRQADHILNFLWETLGEFSQNAPQRDDMTALVICHLDSSAQECATV
ncbi:MAG: PP2C family protein-serine/threonine phosphatase [Candidatus Korobacteraceae bacterium]